MHNSIHLLLTCFRNSFHPATKTTLWLLKIMLPISLLVTMAQYYGVIDVVAGYLDPVMRLVGLPGRSAIAFLTGAFVTTYAGLAAMLQLALTIREATIVGIMICLCHALFVESAVNKRVGSSFGKMFVLRLTMAFVCACYLNMVLPADMSGIFGAGINMADSMQGADGVGGVLLSWVLSSGKMSIMIWLLILGLMILQRVVEAIGLMDKLVKPLHPLMRFCGLSESASYMWLVGNILGISYGSAVMLDLEEQGRITREEANDVNYHLVMNHSLVEDTLVFAAMGISALWIISTRFLFALIVVWGRKGIKKIIPDRK